MHETIICTVSTVRKKETVGDYNRLTHGRQIRRAKKKATMLKVKRIKTSIDKFAAGVYSRYEFLSAVSHMADNLPTEQKDISVDALGVNGALLSLCNVDL